MDEILDMDNNFIQNVRIPFHDGDVANKKYIEDTLSQSHLMSSSKTNVLKYLIDQDESTSLYNITVNGIANFNESPHKN